MSHRVVVAVCLVDGKTTTKREEEGLRRGGELHKSEWET